MLASLDRMLALSEGLRHWLVLVEWHMPLPMPDRSISDPLIAVEALLKGHQANAALSDRAKPEPAGQALAVDDDDVRAAAELLQKANLEPTDLEDPRKLLQLIADKYGTEVVQLRKELQRLDKVQVELYNMQGSSRTQITELRTRLDQVADALKPRNAPGGEEDDDDVAEKTLEAKIQQILDRRQEVDQQKAKAKAEAEAEPIEDEDLDGIPDPVPKIEAGPFIALMQAHLQGKLSHEELETTLGIDAAEAAKPLTWRDVAALNNEDQKQKTFKFLVHEGLLDPHEVSLQAVSQLLNGVFLGRRCLESKETGGRDAMILRSCSLGGPFQHYAWTALGQLRGGYAENDCLEATGTQAGQPIRAAACNTNSPGQRWDFVPSTPNGVFGQLRNRVSGLCMDVDQHSNADKEPTVIVQTCSPDCFQLWSVTGNRTYMDSLLPTAQTDAHDHEPRLDHGHLQLPGDLPDYVAASKADPDQPTKLKIHRRHRIACWIMTSPQNHATKAAFINQTWGAQCDVLLFMTTRHQVGLNTVVLTLGEEENRHFLWRKSIMAWSFLYQHLLNKADWFIRADDDTVILMDNLRDMLDAPTASTEYVRAELTIISMCALKIEMQPTDPHYLGRRLLVEGNDFYSGGAANILSHEALRRFGEGIKNRARDILHNGDTFADDLELAHSLHKVGVEREDTRDARERQRFFVLGLFDERTARRSESPDYWYWKYDFYTPKEEPDECCSTRWIASHYVTPEHSLQLQELHQAGCEAAGQQPWNARVSRPAV
ncbi:uncharacterized protein MONBRDRAFT_28452 [Monosiga brevicollis MX1]|uniref:N-acetylgalactosaminide beta-1,3-galactosyltransferase n=1 Tax=Monosiga brevicollis TaxID=81824 RepID=A9V877_MONBE|nr:uncharacterized protein MONBRDRAFT_28452 [Monosiga brevicollis MX1]EDQ86222.1 predicted protein [Monosiga brevicollis MX1]|eukprot:XP_001748892.1 hypothetical protein [Monosiga brevicollis MX1]